jgi:hypothetical protein
LQSWLVNQSEGQTHFLPDSVTGSIIVYVTRAEKILEKMKANPRDWRIGSLKSVAEAYKVVFRQPGGSHVIFRHSNGAMLSVPAHRPIKPVYVKKFVRLIEDGVAE